MMSFSLRSFDRVTRHPEISMVSVDIFDTLLLRTTMPERVKFGKFARQKAKLFRHMESGNSISPRALHLLRAYAARIAYRNRSLVKGAREATLDEIYKIMLSYIAVNLKMSAEDVESLHQQFRQIEMAAELADLSINNDLKTILVNAANAGKKVVAISDMYLSYDDVKSLLIEKGAWDLFDHLYVSSQFGYGKASGFLFDEVLSRHGLSSYQVAHIGDNWHSDYFMPKGRGIFAFHYPRSFAWRVMRRLRTELSYLRDGSVD